MDCYKFQLLVLQLNIISNWLPVRQQAVCLSESLQKVTANVFYPPFSCRLGGGFMRADWLAGWLAGVAEAKKCFMVHHLCKGVNFIVKWPSNGIL